MNEQEEYIYLISTNPIVESKNKWLPFEEEGGSAYGFAVESLVVTGMNNSIEGTIKAIKESFLVIMTGEMDQTTYFELGLAISLGKKVYYMANKKYDSYDFQLPYELSQLTPISFEQLGDVLDNQTE